MMAQLAKLVVRDQRKMPSLLVVLNWPVAASKAAA
jgi:hypothetical protein